MLTEILSKPYISQLKGDSSDKIGGDGNFLLFSFFFPSPFFSLQEKKVLINRREIAITLTLTSGGKTAVNNVVFTIPDSVFIHM